ncbi:uncharacterized protein LOC124493151 [Dermatophagoides farinae]|uniref:uncharacterized protein LOC124493151 n=1 Tax=Dermatophagoides farinae TaxID=6954 RepID=UPI003F5DBE40
MMNKHDSLSYSSPLYLDIDHHHDHHSNPIKKNDNEIEKSYQPQQHDNNNNNLNNTTTTTALNKSKRIRTIFTPEQLERLENEFEKQQYMVGTGRLYLASTLNLTEAQVKVWFQNRRIKWRKQHLEGYQEGIGEIQKNADTHLSHDCNEENDNDDDDNKNSSF